MNINLKEVEIQAKKELKDEQFKKEVEKCKDKLRNKKSLIERLIPYRITIKIERV